MSENACQVSRVIALEEHAWTPGLRAALLKFGGEDTLTRKRQSLNTTT